MLYFYFSVGYLHQREAKQSLCLTHGIGWGLSVSAAPHFSCLLFSVLHTWPEGSVVWNDIRNTEYYAFN